MDIELIENICSIFGAKIHRVRIPRGSRSGLVTNDTEESASGDRTAATERAGSSSTSRGARAGIDSRPPERRPGESVCRRGLLEADETAVAADAVLARSERADRAVAGDLGDEDDATALTANRGPHRLGSC